MSVVGLIIIVLALGIGLGSNLAIVIDIPSALISLGGAIALLLFSGANTGAMFKGVFASDATADELRAGARGWEFFGIYALVAGAIGTLIGLVIMLKNMDDPAAIGPGMALGLLTHCYGFVLAFLISMPLRKKLEGAVE